MKKIYFLLFTLLTTLHLYAQKYVDTSFGYQLLPVQSYGSAVDFAGTTRALNMNIALPLGDTVPPCGRPLIVIVHGGGFIGGSRNDVHCSQWLRDFAKRGYVTATIDYRLGYFNPSSDIHCNVDNWDCLNASDTAEWYRAVYRAMQDTKGAIRFLVNNASTYQIDRRNIFLIGESAGAITVLTAAFLDLPSEKPNAAFAVNGVLPPNIRYESACIQNNGLAPNIQSMDTSRPDLGSVEGSLNLPNSGYQIRGVGAFYGGLLSNWITQANYNQAPALYMFHQPNDLLVPYGRNRVYHGVAQCAVQFGGCQWIVNRPFLDGSAAIRDNVNLMSAGPLKPQVLFDSTTNNADCLTQLFTPSTVGHAIDNFGLRTYRMASLFAQQMNQSANCNLSINDKIDSSSYTITPNPATHNCIISGLKGTEVIQLLDIHGRILVSHNAKQSHSLNINLDNLATGLYYLQIITPNGHRKSLKLIKQ